MKRGIFAFVVAALMGACGTPAAPPTPVGTAQPSTWLATAPSPTTQPTSTPQVTPAPTGPPTTSGNFDEALAFLTSDTTVMSFDDWAQIKESLGASDVTSASPNEERQRVLVEGLVSSDDRQPSELEVVVGGYGLQSALVHADNWNFDVLDYDWDAVLSHDGPPLFIVNLRDDLDMDPVIAHFDERGYASEEVNGATLWTHDLDPSADWLTGELAILNVGILEDGHTLVMSSSDNAVREFLTAESSSPAAEALAAAEALGGPSAAHLLIGAEQICDFVDPILAASDDENIHDLVEEAGPLHAWDALGVGYSKRLDPIGRIAFSYADATSADDDLKGRRLLAEEGPSLVRPGTLSYVQLPSTRPQPTMASWSSMSRRTRAGLETCSRR